MPDTQQLSESAERGPDLRTSALRSFAFDRLSANTAVLDDAGIIIDTNTAWRLFSQLNGGSERLTGPAASYLGACDRAAAVGCNDAEAIAAGLRDILAGDRQHFDYDYPCPSTIEDRWFMMTASAAPVVNGAGVVLSHVDITARRAVQDRLVAQANHDELTGLPNRRSAVRFIDRHLADCRRTGNLLRLLFIDLDGFKAINDKHGHHAGDELLVKVAARARRVVRETDHLARFGGDEFVLTCPGLNEEEISVVAARLRQVMAEPFQIGPSEISIGASVGCATGDAESTVESLLRSADAQMYLHKGRRTGRLP